MLPQQREIPFWTVGCEIVLLLFTDHYVSIPTPGGVWGLMLILFLFFGCCGQQALPFRTVPLTECSSGTSAADVLIPLTMVRLQTNVLVHHYFHWFYLLFEPAYTSWTDLNHSRLVFYWIHLPVPPLLLPPPPPPPLR